jgi:putative alpha-1,2-mannosidase
VEAVGNVEPAARSQPNTGNWLTLFGMVNPSLMYRSLAAIAILTATLPVGRAQASASDVVSEVNPLIGTANGGNVFPGASMPFGMVQFSPEATPINPKRPIAAPDGYEFRATSIRGFSLTNVEGWGCAGGSGDVPVMPTTKM